MYSANLPVMEDFSKAVFGQDQVFSLIFSTQTRLLFGQNNSNILLL